jgi:hypothetical protein
MVRDYRVANIALRPVRDMGQGRVQLLKRARIVIDFPAASHSGASWEPRSDYERMVGRLLLNFRVAQGWQERRGLRKAAAARDAHPFSFAGDMRLATFRVGDGNRSNNETSTKENTLIKISGRRVREIFGAGARMDQVALYASAKGEMRLEVPAEGGIPTGVSEMPVLRYDLNRNGAVDDGDYFVAYVSGASDWGYDSTRASPDSIIREYKFKINRYDDRRTYWLALKTGVGAAMGSFAQPVAAGVTARDYFENNIYLRTPQALSESSGIGGLDWSWIRFTLNRADTAMSLNLPGIKASDSVSVRFSAGGSYPNSYINAFLDADTVCSNCADGSWYSARGRERNPRDLIIRHLNSHANNVDNNKVFYELNGAHVKYNRSLGVSADAGKLEIFSSHEAGPARYRLTKAGASDALAYIVRIPLDEREAALVDTVRGQEYVFSDTGGLGVRYMVMLEKDIVDYSDSLNVVDNRRVIDAAYQIRDLRDLSIRADYLIITHENFLDAALKLAAHKAFVGFAHPKVVMLGDVLDQFGGGNMDPVALRNFLLFAYRNWVGGVDLSYVVLMGSGHYDYKYVSTRAVNYMPVMYVNDGNLVNNFGDDYYTFLSDREYPGYQNAGYYSIGRLPAKSLSEAFDMVEKIIEMEDPRVAELDSWRNRVLMTADDDQQGPGIDHILGSQAHFESSERATRIIEARRPDVDLRKLYLFEYAWDENYNKPAARRAFINEINSGVSVVNWFGHGSINQVADEMIFSRSDVMALYNRKRYPLFSMFSCSIGKFDLPGEESLGEVLVKRPGAGAIAVLSSTRDVTATANENLALPFFRELFRSDSNLSIGLALRFAKQTFVGLNGLYNKLYVLIGDPSITLSARNRNVSLGITGASGALIADTLRALQQITITGTVNAPLSKRGAGSNFGGPGAFAALTLFNPPEQVRRKDGGTFTDPRYTMPGSPVFSAKIPIGADGRFSQQLLLPMNLSFGKSGAKLIAYVWKEGENISGTGHVGGFIFEGTESGGINDTVPPRISIRPVYNIEAMDRAGVFVKNRITAQLPLTVEIKIEDESGINVLGAGPDEGLTMEVKGALSKRGINHLFQFYEGNFRQGVATVAFEESAIKSGTHELVVSAQDLLGNVARQSFTLEIVDPAELKLDHVLNIPNPVKMGRETRFYYYHSNAPGDFNMNITIRIYSLGGRLLSVIRNPRNGEAWVPKDQRGNLLTPNVYLYQITASSPSVNKTVKSKIKKLVVHPPR